MSQLLFMKSETFRASPFSALRRALLLAGGTALLAASCVNRPAYGPEANVFAPRYGYGSQPSQLAERPAAPGAPLAPASADRGAAPAKSGEPRKVPDIKRDPSNTTVDVTPPPSKTAPEASPEAPAAAAETSAAPASEAAPAAPSPVSAPPAVKPAVAREDLLFGQPVVGKKGFVYSPYAPDKGQVDVQDIPSGTKVKCPYTNKVFRVP